MSGVKTVRVVDRSKELAEAMRRAAEAWAAEQARREEERRRREEERRRREMEDARADLAAARREAEAARQDLSTRGLGGVAGVVGAAAEGAPIEADAEAAVLRRRAREVRVAVQAAVGFARYVKDLPSTAGVARTQLVEAAGRARGPEDLDRALADFEGREGVFSLLGAAIRGAESAREWIRACEAARIPLEADLVGARAQVEAFLVRPVPDGLTAVRRCTLSIQSAGLAHRLEERSGRLRALAQAAQDAGEAAHTLPWREGFAAELAGAARRAVAGDWQGVGSVLDELDALLSERARWRVERLLRAAEAAGLRVDTARRDDRTGAWMGEVYDDTGHLLHVEEATPGWAGADVDGALEVHGPENWDGPSCVRGGIAEIARALKSQDVEVEVRSREGDLVLSTVDRAVIASGPAGARAGRVEADPGRTGAPVGGERARRRREEIER